MYSCSNSQPRHKMEVSAELKAPSALFPGKTPGNLWLGGCVRSRPCFDDFKKRKILCSDGDLNPGSSRL
jgi:hypothetical protein